MANPIKSAIVQKNIENTVYDIMIRTDTDNVACKDGVSLTKKIADLSYAIANIIASDGSSGNVDASIKTATNNLYNQIMGVSEGTTVNSNFNTIKKISDWLENDDNKTASDIIKDISDINTRLDSISTGGGGGTTGSGYVASETAPSNTSVLWLDMSNNAAVLKYYDITNKKWNPVNAVWS